MGKHDCGPDWQFLRGSILLYAAMLSLIAAVIAAAVIV